MRAERASRTSSGGRKPSTRSLWTEVATATVDARKPSARSTVLADISSLRSDRGRPEPPTALTGRYALAAAPLERAVASLPRRSLRSPLGPSEVSFRSTSRRSATRSPLAQAVALPSVAPPAPRPFNPPGPQRPAATRLPSRFARSLRSLAHPSHGGVSRPRFARHARGSLRSPLAHPEALPAVEPRSARQRAPHGCRRAPARRSCRAGSARGTTD